MAPIAAQVIQSWNSRPQDHSGKGSKGLIAVSFDQRNHGSRLVDELHNQAWREGNPSHAQDMFSCLHGSATDTSHLISYLQSYIFHEPNHPSITQHLVLGISLGGHAAWHCLLSDPRITAAVVGIGCPDYTRLMTDRARLSKLQSYHSTSPPGASFLGSKQFPKALQEAIAKSDPAGLFLPAHFNPIGPDAEVDAAALAHFQQLLRQRLQGKRILNLSGKVDKLVPYAAGEPFLNVFKKAIAEDPSLRIGLDDVLFDNVGHAFPQSMVEKATDWICEVVDLEDGFVTSKI
jgi:pimeloyl-ACP methyl ester carboxylesterase